MHFLRKAGFRVVVYVVLGDQILDLSEPEARAVIQEFKSRVVREQKRAGLPQYWICVLESTGGLHANLVFPATKAMLRKLRASEAFSRYLRGARAIQRVYDFDGLVRNYLTKERPPNVRGGWALGARLKGSHRLGEGGGDRVQLSTALRQDAAEAGLVEQWQRTTSRNLQHSPAIGARRATGIGAPAEMSGAHVVRAVRPSVCKDAPVEAREGIGQEPQGGCPAPPVERQEAVQLLLFPSLPPRPRISGSDLRQYREQHGVTQLQIGARLGIRDRSHVANFERGHDGLSPQRQRLLQHIIETERIAA